MKEFLIGKEASNQRADKFVRKFLSDAPLSFIYKVFRKKDVKVNHHWIPAEYILQEGDVLQIYITEEQLQSFQKSAPITPKPFPYPIIYEDENILIVQKPKGILVHGDETEKRKTLTNDVLNYLYGKGEYDPRKQVGFTPAPAHRLDRNTSGLVIFGKNIPTLQTLYDVFKNHEEMDKKYYALVVGTVTKDGDIRLPLSKNEKTGLVRVDSNGKSAWTEYHVVKKWKEYTLLSISLHTGRTHQIRVHLSAIGHPIVGDSKYGNFAVNKSFAEKYHYENQFLHAYSISFFDMPEPLNYLSGKEFHATLPKKEKEILEALSC